MNKSMTRFIALGTLMMGAVLMAPAQASIVLDNTRVVYAEHDREASVKMTNSGSKPVVVQSWIDKGAVKEDPSRLKVPFVLMPPMTRIEPGEGQTVRVIYTGEALPKDHESVYYLNMLEIPPKITDPAKKDFVQVALRTRIKMFYRPADLKGSASEAPDKLSWSLVQKGSGWALQGSNRSPYHVSMSKVELIASGKSAQVGDGMVAPGAVLELPLTSRPEAGTQVKFTSLNDYGAPKEHLAPLNP